MNQTSKPRHGARRLVAVAGAAATALAGLAVLASYDAFRQQRHPGHIVGSQEGGPPTSVWSRRRRTCRADSSPPSRAGSCDANGIRQHVVIGGDGPPLLLVHGWPENWYAWRLVMPELAKDYTVIAVDQRGIGLTEKTADGYDAATLADDLAALMTKLGHERFAVVGHDTGDVVCYALAADHRDRVERLAVAEIPGPPGVGDLDAAPGAADVRARAGQRQAVAHPVQPGRRRPDPRHGQQQRRRLLPLRVRDPGRRGDPARLGDRVLHRPLHPRPGRRCGPASGSTAPGTRPWPRTARCARPPS